MQPVTIDCSHEAAFAKAVEVLALALKSGDLIVLSDQRESKAPTFAQTLLDVLQTGSSNALKESFRDGIQIVSGLHFGTLTLIPGQPFPTASILERVEEPGVVIFDSAGDERELNPTLGIQIDGRAGCTITASGKADALHRFQRSLLIKRFLDAQGFGIYRRSHFMGDASARAYELIHHDEGVTSILMNAPAQPDGPPIRNGLPYSKIAKLAEDVRAFVGVTNLLANKGFRVPRIHDQDLDQGLLLIENLGAGSILTPDRQPIVERYKASVETLATMHETHWENSVVLSNGHTHKVPDFDRDAMTIEVELLVEWYAPYRSNIGLNNQERDLFGDIWNSLIDVLEATEKSILLRDFHSPNIIWMDNETGINRIGLIDYQDALIGPTAYDVASIAQDARVDISEELENELLDHYCKSRTAFDEGEFRKAYAIMAAERATKILGIFVRLSKRDGKHIYLDHLPRIEDYLRRALRHPVLKEYRDWVEGTLFK